MHLGIFWIQCTLLFTSAVCLQVEHQSISASAANQSPPQFAILNNSSFFSVPCGVNRLRVLVVGGGGGGGSGPAGGGAAGFVRSAVYEVEPKAFVKITVGKGGKGSTSKENCGQDSEPGGRSTFGLFLYADGGGNHKGTCYGNWQAASGGSGGGEGCVNVNGFCRSGAGGSGGSNGNSAVRGKAFGIGNGQGSYSSQLRQFSKSSISEGAGGKGSQFEAAGGGGAGGILINGFGPSGGNGAPPIGSQGGKGYGAGGGSGFLVPGERSLREYVKFHNGGNGADGVVYIEWWMDSRKSSNLFKIARSKSGDEEECAPDSPPSSTSHPDTSRSTSTTAGATLTSRITSPVSTAHPDTTRPTQTSSSSLTTKLTTQQVMSTSTAAAPGGNYSVFTANGTFVVPMGVYRVRALAVGGGGGGYACCFGGGGSGYVRSAEFDVTPGESMHVIVGAGGAGGPNNTKYCSRLWMGGGGTSSFGYILYGDGGSYTTNYWVGSGGSGGGEGTYCTPATSGAGATDGSSGLRYSNTTGSTNCNTNFGVGSGQGSFTPLFKLFTRNRLTPGAGGSGRTVRYPYYAGGGGGGGVLLNGSGPTAQAGVGGIPSGFGGSGFGAGGGAGGYVHFVTSGTNFHFGGGRGADGLVYVEW